jgi:hypothetical protein
MPFALLGHQGDRAIRSSPVALHPLIGGHDQLAEPRQIDVAGRRSRLGHLPRKKLMRASSRSR